MQLCVKGGEEAPVVWFIVWSLFSPHFQIGNERLWSRPPLEKRKHSTLNTRSFPTHTHTQTHTHTHTHTEGVYYWFLAVITAHSGKICTPTSQKLKSQLNCICAHPQINEDESTAICGPVLALASCYRDWCAIMQLTWFFETRTLLKKLRAGWRTLWLRDFNFLNQLINSI